MIVPGLLVKSAQNYERAQEVTADDKCAAVKIADLVRETKSKAVVKPKFTADFPGSCDSGRSRRAHFAGA